ncbi:hypothetical protein C1H46_028515 [Malus baccata]|uniref:Uncharacterized protein n=1 Tax=Malus baccata TaxID=106549 RepID=A0A540LI02_MALBA|nr:hypothetical protein C1H46_028515 [Malus baccata]
MSILDLIPLKSGSVTARRLPPRLDLFVNVGEVTVIEEVDNRFDRGDKIGGRVHRVVEGRDRDSFVALAKRVGRVDVAVAVLNCYRYLIIRAIK